MTASIATQYHPLRVTVPGETLADLLEERGMTPLELAARTGLSLGALHGIVQGETALTPEIALRLERALSVQAGFWLAREQRYQDWKTRLQEAAGLQGEGRPDGLSGKESTHE